MTVKAIIERGDDGTYGVYIDLDENRLGYGIIGDGKTVNEAIEDFYNSYREMEALYKDENKPFQEVTFEFKYDVASFLAFYSKKFTLAGLETITGVSQGQLSHYVTGRKKPSAKTIQKIEKSLHDFASEISQVQFI